MVLWLARIVLFFPVLILHPTWIKGKKNIPKGKVILCSNHYSNWDAILYNIYNFKKPRFLAKKELFENKLCGWFLRAIGAFPIDREANDITAIKNCMKFLKEGKQLFIFPEGTRLVNDEEVLGEIKSGVSMIAIKTQTPIVPIWIRNRPKLFRRSVYYVGKPFELSDFYGKKLDDKTLKEADEVVRQKMIEVGAEEKAKKENKKSKKKKQ